MLPPTLPGSSIVCSGGSSILTYSGADAGAINCSPATVGVNGDIKTSGTVSAAQGVASTGTISTTQDVSAGGNVASSQNITASGAISSGSTVSANIVNIGNGMPINSDGANTVGYLTNMGGCAANYALTKNPDGTFGCIAITDITGLGKVTLPDCATGSYLTSDGHSFSCAAPSNLSVSCPGGQFLTGIVNGQPECAPSPIAGLSCASGNYVVGFDASGTPICAAPSGTSSTTSTTSSTTTCVCNMPVPGTNVGMGTPCGGSSGDHYHSGVCVAPGVWAAQ